MNGETFLKLCLVIAALSSAVHAEEWKASVVKRMDALVSSCVVVPCSFSHPKESLPTSRLRAKWQRSTNKDQLIYYEDTTQVLENFRGRTRLLGHLGQGNCTLEIKEIKDHDNGPFCFRIELARSETDTDTKDKFSFVEDCVEFNMKPEATVPFPNHKEYAIEGRPYTITCTVKHTCPTHPPQIKWSRGSKEEITENQREIHEGSWETSSILTFTPEAKDDHEEISCTAQFNELKTSNFKMTLRVKRSENYNYIIIPTAVAIGSAAIFGGLCFLMMKKYKRRIAEMQSQDGTMLNRLSRLSRRIRSSSIREIRSGQRSKNKSGDQTFSKPRFPSPKSKPRACSYNEDMDDGDDYMNTADLNVYGNL